VRFKLLGSITVCTVALGAGVYWYMTRAAEDQVAQASAAEARRVTTQMEEVRRYYTERVAVVCRKQGLDVTNDYAGKPNAVPLPDVMTSNSCVSCHNAHPESPKTDWKLGDVRGVLEVVVPVERPLAAAQAGARWVAGGIAAALVLLLGVVALLSERLIFRPLK